MNAPDGLNMGTARRIIPDINGPRTKKVRMGREGGEEPEVGGGGGGEGGGLREREMKQTPTLDPSIAF